MNQKKTIPYTLRELLCELFFEDNPPPFWIIYDSNNILSDFFEKEITSQPGYKLLIIHASQKPTEFLDRIRIVEDFNEKTGWYDHSWIIHITGNFSSEIDTFGSFHYYELVGKRTKIETFYDLLMIPDLNLIKSKDTESLLEKEPSLNEFIFNYLIDTPISSYIDSDKSFNECTAWMTLLTSNPNLNPTQRTESPLWISISQEKKAFSHEKLLLELIYLNNFLAPKVLDDSIGRTINKYFYELILEHKITDLTLSEDWMENLLRIVQFIFHYGKFAFLKKIKGKKKIDTIDNFIFPKKKELKVPTPNTIEFFGNFINEWILQNDKTLLKKFQQVTTLIRKRYSSLTIKKENIQDFESKFSYIGIIDIKLASTILENQLEKRLKKDQWLTKISRVISIREDLWKKCARFWWKDRNLIYSEKRSISVYQLWDFTEKAGLLLSFEIKSSNWRDIKKLAWEIEELFMVIMKPEFIQIFKSEDIFKPFLDIIIELKSNYIEFQKKIEIIFSKFYDKILNSGDIHKIADFSKIVWNKTINLIDENNSIGFIFCDALRQDLALELIQKIEEIWEQNKSIISENEIQELQSISFLPSITNLGWNQILKWTDEIYVKISNDNLISGIQTKSEKKINYNPNDRNSRILQILKESGKDIELLDIDINNFKETRSIIHQKLQENDYFLIPILWYEKLDNHDLSFVEFIGQKDKFLEELKDIVWKLHETGIEFIFILSDHGFTFVKNEDELEDKPNGMLHKRYCLSPNNFTEEECNKYPKWNIFTPELFQYNFDDEKNNFSSIIVPLGYSNIFKKSKKDTDFYIHGGLSYQECDLLHISTLCKLKPKVEIEKIIVKDHEKVPGQNVYLLKERENSKFLEILLKTYKKGASSSPLRPIEIKVICKDSRIRIDPNQELKLGSGMKRKFELSFDKKFSINSIEIEVIDSKNEIITTKRFLTSEPSIYDPEKFF